MEQGLNFMVLEQMGKQGTPDQHELVDQGHEGFINGDVFFVIAVIAIGWNPQQLPSAHCSRSHMMFAA